MPSKPLWIGKLPEAIAQLERSSLPLIDRRQLEQLLGVGTRRAQQILAPFTTEHLGRNCLADRISLIEGLRRLASQEEASYERRRRTRLAETLTDLDVAWRSKPRVLIAAPSDPVSLGSLPDGIELRPGALTIRFASPQDALEKLLALTLSIGNDFETFDRLSNPPLYPLSQES